jgi:hypothetical protein
LTKFTTGQRVAAIALGAVLQLLAAGAFCDVLAQENLPQSPDSIIHAIDSDTYRIGNVTIDRIAGEIQCPGWVNMDSGMVEYLAVAPLGKTHESVLVIDARPIHMQLALLLLGLNYGQNLRFQGDSLAPQGDSVYLQVSWHDEAGDTVTHEASDLILNLVTDSAMPGTPWIFTGSLIFEGGLMADAEGSVIATYSDPVAILNNPLPERKDDIYFAANHRVLPPQDTKIWLTMKKR